MADHGIVQHLSTIPRIPLSLEEAAAQQQQQQQQQQQPHDLQKSPQQQQRPGGPGPTPPTSAMQQQPMAPQQQQAAPQMADIGAIGATLAQLAASGILDAVGGAGAGQPQRPPAQQYQQQQQQQQQPQQGYQPQQSYQQQHGTQVPAMQQGGPGLAPPLQGQPPPLRPPMAPGQPPRGPPLAQPPGQPGQLRPQGMIPPAHRPPPRGMLPPGQGPPPRGMPPGQAPPPGGRPPPPAAPAHLQARPPMQARMQGQPGQPRPPYGNQRTCRYFNTPQVRATFPACGTPICGMTGIPDLASVHLMWLTRLRLASVTGAEVLNCAPPFPRCCRAASPATAASLRTYRHLAAQAWRTGVVGQAPSGLRKRTLASGRSSSHGAPAGAAGCEAAAAACLHFVLDRLPSSLFRAVNCSVA